MREKILEHFGGNFTGFYSRHLPDLRHGKANCPFHDCDSRSLSVDTKTGLFNCHFPGCSASGDFFKFYELKHNLNGDFPAVLRGIAADFGINGAAEKKHLGPIVKTYDYSDASGKLIFQVVRYDNPKDFRQRRPDGKGGWIWSTKGIERFLYRLPEVLKADEVWIVEGEKDVDALRALGFTATCNPGGASEASEKKPDKKWLPAYTETLAGKQVFIIPDNDEAGRKHVENVARNLHGKAASVKVLELPGLPKAGDVSDFIQAIGDPDTAAERLSIMADGAGEWTPPAESELPTETPSADTSPAKGLPPPLTPEDTRVRLTSKPPDPDYIFYFQGKGMITRGSVGGIVGASGTGKTRQLSHWAVAMAMGGRWTFYEAMRPLRVLLMCAEDDQDQVDRNLWAITGGRAIDNLHVKSVRGLIPPLMVQENSNPVPGPSWTWLKKSVELHHPLDVLMIDPKSRFYGLEENKNEENVAWVQCLEKLSQETGGTCIFSHHPPKGTHELNQWMARGGGGLVDACRWFMGMLPMTEEEGKRYGVDDWMNHFQAAVVKTNIGQKSRVSAWFRINNEGIIEAADVVDLKESNWGRRLAELLQDRLQDADCSPKYLTARELTKDAAGKAVANTMKEIFSGFRRQTDMPGAIKWAVKWDLLKEVDVPQEKGRNRLELVPLAEAMKER